MIVKYKNKPYKFVRKGPKNSRLRDEATGQELLAPNVDIVAGEAARVESAPRQFSKASVGDSIFNEFLDLATNLSPENLTCDGELSPRQVMVKRQMLTSAWQRLEREINMVVSEDMVWEEYIANRR